MDSLSRLVLAISVAALVFGCDKTSEKPVTDTPADPVAPVAEPAPAAQPAKDASDGLCDGEIDVADIPGGPLKGVIAGRELIPNQSIVKASQFMKQVTFAFNSAKNADPSKICFAGGTDIHAAVTYKTGKMAVASGTYKFRAGEENSADWTAWFSYLQDGGTPDSVNTQAYYGILVVDSYDLGVRPAELFAPAGTASGKLLICFGDENNSFIGGTFSDIPVCQ